MSNFVDVAVNTGGMGFIMDDAPDQRFTQSDIDANKNASTIRVNAFCKGEKGDPLCGKVVRIWDDEEGRHLSSISCSGQESFKYSGIAPAINTLVDVDGEGCVIQSNRKPIGGCLERGLVLSVNTEDNTCDVAL